MAATYDGAILRLFVDGAPVTSNPAGGAMPASGGPLRIGGNAVWDEWFAGLIDEVRIYRRALSAAEIERDMTSPVVSGASPRPSPTVPGAQPAASERASPLGAAPAAGSTSVPPSGGEGGRGARISAASVTRARICRRPRRGCRRRTTWLRFRLSQPTRVVVVLRRAGRRAESMPVSGRLGLNVISLDARSLRPGSYRIELVPLGGEAMPTRIRLRVG